MGNCSRIIKDTKAKTDKYKVTKADKEHSLEPEAAQKADNIVNEDNAGCDDSGMHKKKKTLSRVQEIERTIVKTYRKDIWGRFIKAVERYELINDGDSIAVCVSGKNEEIKLTDNDLVFITNGSCTESTIYGDHEHAPTGSAKIRKSGCWSLWKNIARQDMAFGNPEKFCSDVEKSKWESATITTSDEKIISYIEKICKRDSRSGKVVTGGIVSCKDSSWLLSWTINRQGQFKKQKKDEVCIWVYGLFTDAVGDYIRKPMKDCCGCGVAVAAGLAVG